SRSTCLRAPRRASRRSVRHRLRSASAPDGAAATSVRTTCPYCGVGCGLLATPGTPTTIRADTEHPANLGRMCSKGAALGDTLDLDGRLLHAEIRGRRASLDDALDVV